MVDFLIVGAGFSGVILAERLASQLGRTCLIVERRAHVGGNAYDEYSDVGILTHRYGPHYFRTNSQRIVDYLSQFTLWRPVRYRILSYARARYWSFPVNLTTFEQLIGREANEVEFQSYLEASRVAIASPQNSEEFILSRIGRELYELLYKGYTVKQWGCEPRELDASVCGRIPIRTTRDDGYFDEAFQALPSAGYTRMFENMLASTAGIEVLLSTEFREVVRDIRYRHLIYTGPIDEYFDFRFGPLPYRSLRFERESFSGPSLVARAAVSGKRGYWQPAVQVNYPDSGEFTRIVELKHVTGQISRDTTIVREYPEEFGPGKEPYYPVPSRASRALYEKYAARAQVERNVSFVGRLGTYRYYNMDQVVGMALACFGRLSEMVSKWDVDE